MVNNVLAIALRAADHLSSAGSSRHVCVDAVLEARSNGGAWSTRWRMRGDRSLPRHASVPKARSQLDRTSLRVAGRGPSLEEDRMSEKSPGANCGAGQEAIKGRLHLDGVGFRWGCSVENHGIIVKVLRRQLGCVHH